MTARFTAQAFGLRWESDTPLPLFAAATGVGPADVLVERADQLEPRPGGRAVNNGEIFPDGIRFTHGGAVFDMVDGRSVRWAAPGADELPLAFYGTVTGLLLAWRGLVPLHGSAVAFDDRAVLIAGRSGAGKSTLCHALTERGGLLVSDDLSALMPVDGWPMLQPGRPAIRLVDRTGARDPRDKLLVTPRAIDPDRPLRLAALVLLQDRQVAPGPAEASAALARQMFRPQWMRALPGAQARSAALFLAAQRIAIHVLPPVAAAPDTTPDEKAQAVLELLG